MFKVIFICREIEEDQRLQRKVKMYFFDSDLVWQMQFMINKD